MASVIQRLLGFMAHAAPLAVALVGLFDPVQAYAADFVCLLGGQVDARRLPRREF